MKEYWMLDPELFKPTVDGRILTTVVIDPKQYYDYESDPEYIRVRVVSAQDRHE